MMFFLLASSLLFFLTLLSFAAAASGAGGGNGGLGGGGGGLSFELPPLPYAYDALEPYIGRQTLEIHHDKHHAKYVNTLNDLIKGTTFEKNKSLTLEDVVEQSYEKNQILFNNAAQSWNHAFYWNCMKKNGGGSPPKRSTLARLIDTSFGSFDAFKSEFAVAGNTAFGSGWAWLVYNHHRGSSNKPSLQVLKTIGADNPMTNTDDNVVVTPILTMDVWEHAYYLDYQNMRNTYVDTFLDQLVNWDFVAANLERAMPAAHMDDEESVDPEL
jgi:superoxide dismutase, Fe-Mn family